MKRALLLGLAVACRHAAPPPVAVQVVVTTPDDPVALERYVTIPIETALTGQPGAVDVRSETVSGRAVVTVEANGELFAIRQAVMERLRDVALPPGVSASLAAPAERAVLRFAVRGAGSPLAARRLADWVLGRELLHIPGVAEVSTCGGLIEEAHVTVTSAAASGVSLHELVAAITGALPLSHAHLGVEDLAPLVVKTVNGAPVRVGDIATIARDHAPRDCVAIDDHDADAVVTTVWLRHGSDRDAVRAGVEKALATLPLPTGASLPLVPDAVQAAIALPVAPRDEQLRLLDQLRGPDVHATVELGDADGGPLTAPPDEARVYAASAADLVAVAARAKTLPGATWIGPDKPTAWVRITGPDLATLADLAAHVPFDVVERVGIATVLTEQIELDRKQLAALGVTADDAQAAFAASRGALDAGTLYQDGRAIAIVVTSRDPTVRSATGAAVPLSAIAAIHVVPEPRSIHRDRGQRWVGLRIRVRDRDALPGDVAAVKLPPGYAMSVGD